MLELSSNGTHLDALRVAILGGNEQGDRDSLQQLAGLVVGVP